MEKDVYLLSIIVTCQAAIDKLDANDYEDEYIGSSVDDINKSMCSLRKYLIDAYSIKYNIPKEDIQRCT